MKGHEKVLAALNQLLAEELTAVNQYMVHSEMCENWGYQGLHKAIEKTAFDEMRHAEALIRRILFLEGTPTVSKLNPVQIGKEVKAMHELDLELERAARTHYNAAIVQTTELHDAGTRELLEHILGEEEKHIDYREAQLDQITQMGVSSYLVGQTRE